MPLVIITTSGVGNRLLPYTNYTNKSLLPLGDKYCICHIIESYPIGTNFVITLGHKGELVREFLTLAYPQLSLTFVCIDLYEGAGSSLECF